MNAVEQKHYLPGYRGIIRDISEAGGSLCRLDELVEEHGLERLLDVLDLGMVVYQAGDLLFVPIADFRIYSEIADDIANGADDDAVEEAEPLMSETG